VAQFLTERIGIAVGVTKGNGSDAVAGDNFSHEYPDSRLSLFRHAELVSASIAQRGSGGEWTLKQVQGDVR
jgi:hypothetical protein